MEDGGREKVGRVGVGSGGVGWGGVDDTLGVLEFYGFLDEKSADIFSHIAPNATPLEFETQSV